jgi:hypothetical protein
MDVTDDNTVVPNFDGIVLAKVSRISIDVKSPNGNSAPVRQQQSRAPNSPSPRAPAAAATSVKSSAPTAFPAAGNGGAAPAPAAAGASAARPKPSLAKPQQDLAKAAAQEPDMLELDMLGVDAAPPAAAAAGSSPKKDVWSDDILSVRQRSLPRLCEHTCASTPARVRVRPSPWLRGRPGPHTRQPHAHALVTTPATTTPPGSLTLIPLIPLVCSLAAAAAAAVPEAA